MHVHGLLDNPPPGRASAEGNKMRKSNAATRLARQRGRKLRADEALAELERAQKVFLQSDKASGHHLNDDKSPLINLLSCIVCKRTMKLEKALPTLRVVTSFNIVASCAKELSWCDYSAEVEMRRPEGEGKMRCDSSWHH